MKVSINGPLSSLIRELFLETHKNKTMSNYGIIAE